MRSKKTVWPIILRAQRASARRRWRSLGSKFRRHLAIFARDEARYEHEAKFIALIRALADLKHTYEINRALAMDPKDIPHQRADGRVGLRVPSLPRVPFSY